jgi:deoxyinosine 3'endonuclease (endonuclease V)
MLTLIGPYVPGFLAFREADPIIRMVRRQMEADPSLTPDVLLVDGNGLLHPRRFGLACHVGLQVSIS